MKIAIIGNSHLAALKLAVQNEQFRTEQHEITFWGIAGDGFAETFYEGGHFRTPYQDFALKVSDGKYESLPAHLFDAIVFHGLPLNVGRYLALLRKAGDDVRWFSRASLCDGIRMHLGTESTYRLVQSLRGDYNRRVLMSPLALKSEDSDIFTDVSVSGEELKHLHSCISAILADIRVEYVEQPSDTICEYKYTKRRFCLNSVRLVGNLSIEHGDDDYDHMNGLYGARVLRAIAAQL